MQIITVEELINYKILPFNIYTKGDKLLFHSGEVLTPGKFLQLRHIDLIYRKENEETITVVPPAEEEQAINKDIEEIIQEPVIDVTNSINRRSVLPPQEQVKLKLSYENAVTDISKITPAEIVSRMKDIRNKIQDEYFAMFDNVVYASQLRLLGEYDKCHAINVAILTAALSRKLGKSEDFISDIILAALLHDIGKICLPKVLVNKQGMTIQEQKLYQAHTTIGYNLIKNKMNLSEKIAKVALEHHERNDGTGYPHGKSGDFISQESQIVRVCNYFDNLTFNKTSHKVYNSKDALKIMLEMGSKLFAIDVLYSFVYMYNYDDTQPLDEMIIL